MEKEESKKLVLEPNSLPEDPHKDTYEDQHKQDQYWKADADAYVRDSEEAIAKGVDHVQNWVGQWDLLP